VRDEIDDDEDGEAPKTVKLTYPIAVRNTGCLTVTVTDHFIAVVVAQSLKLPMPISDTISRVLRTLSEDPDDDISTSIVTFQYLDETKSDTITLEVTPK
jgi:hypothetical protein